MRTEYSLASGGKRRPARKPLEIVMTPMIDVIFLLLIFFLTTSSFQMIEQALPSGVSEMQSASGDVDEPPPEPTEDALDQIIVKLEQDGPRTVTRLNGNPIAHLEQLSVRLTALRQVKPDLPVIVDPAPEVAARDVLAAYDTARRVGLLRVYLATRPQGR